MTIVNHEITLSYIPHRKGQSRNLEQKRRSLWEKMSDSEKKWIISIWDTRRTVFNISDFSRLNNATDRVLFVLATSSDSLSAMEICYLMLSKWYKTIHITTASAKLAFLSKKGLADITTIGRVRITDEGVKTIEGLVNKNRNDRKRRIKYEIEKIKKA
tara:strand:- start:473 stop:946 length:474 start_codon:yes stop_codon:yes gene_type:complete